jgi:chromosomal replication initiator protein
MQAERRPTPVDAVAAWARVRPALRARVGEENFTSWIAPLRCSSAGGGLVLEAPDRPTRDWIARHLLGVIEDTLAAALGRPCAVDLRIPVPPTAPWHRTVAPAADHTFETFVVGESNAHAAKEARGLAAGAAPRLLFIHGPSGVGKTHLLHATYHALVAGGGRVLCLPAAELVAGLVGAYGTQAEAAFWQDLAPMDALLLDDVHSLVGQQAVQTRLIEGLVAWQDTGRALLLTSDRAPEHLPELAAKVRARFEGGVVAAVDPPEPALRLAILQTKARALGLVLETRLAARIAVEVGGNVRRLEGVLTRLLAHARLLGRRVDEALALEVLPDLRPRLPAALSVDRILDETAAAFGGLARALRGRSRRPDLALARQVAMYLARKLLNRPFAQLAAAFARDHTTVLHACQTISARLGTDRALAAIVEEIERRLTADTR